MKKVDFSRISTENIAKDVCSESLQNLPISSIKIWIEISVNVILWSQWVRGEIAQIFWSSSQYIFIQVKILQFFYFGFMASDKQLSCITVPTSQHLKTICGNIASNATNYSNISKKKRPFLLGFTRLKRKHGVSTPFFSNDTLVFCPKISYFVYTWWCGLPYGKINQRL